jgi:hypothetical protein
MSAARSSIRLRLTGVAAAAVLAGSLTACGSGGSSTAADSGPSTTSPSTSSSAPTASTSATETPAPIDGGGEVAVADFVKKLQAAVAKTHYAHMAFTMSGGGTDITGSGDSDYTTKPPSTDVTMSLGAQKMRLITVDGTVYMDTGQTGGKYLSYRLDDPNNPLGQQLTTQLDPASQMESFAKAVQSVSSLGTKTVDGRKLGEYQMVIDSSALASQGSDSTGLPTQITSDVYFDDEGRLAKISMALGAVQYDATLTDFDKQVQVTAPSKGQIVQQPTG